MLVRRGSTEAVYRVLVRMYATSTPEQAERKVRERANSVVLGADGLIRDVPAQRPPHDRSTKHRERQLDHLLATTRSMDRIPAHRRALGTFFFGFSTKSTLKKVVACGMQAFQQLRGFNTLVYSSATLFQEVGFNQPTAVGSIISGTNFAFTLVALKFVFGAQTLE